jgi:mono/diheme cytochrome c family protein
MGVRRSRMLLKFGPVLVTSFMAGTSLAGETGPAPLGANRIEAGRKIYQQYCASCHGPGGRVKGDWGAAQRAGRTATAAP